MTQRIGIIGAGIAGLSAAVRLRAQGHDVTVFEANDYVGGKLHATTLNGYRFDLGPSLFTMPQYVDALFELFDENPRDHFNYLRKETVCHYFWEDGTRFNAPADRVAFVHKMSEKFGEDPKKIDSFLRRNAQKYYLTNPLFIEQSLHRLRTYTSAKTLKAIAQLPLLDLHKSLHRTLKTYFKNPKSIQFFSRHATYNGSSPYKTPGIMSLIPHLEMHHGTFYPEKGMHEISQSIYRLALRHGVIFHLNEPVQEILLTNTKTASGLRSAKNTYSFDIVVSNMDVVPTYRKLLAHSKAPERILRQERSSSALIFYWGIRKSFKQLDLHNIFFSDHYREEFNAIFEAKTLHEDPTVYINITKKHTPEDAPEGCENWFVMINAPGNYEQDWPLLIQLSRARILAKLNRLLGEDISGLIAVEHVLDPRGIESSTQSYRGALYGAASNSQFAAFLRHPNHRRALSNVYFCGGSAHPGGGIPLCLQSGKIVSELIAHDRST